MKGGMWLNIAAVGTWVASGVYPMTVMSGQPFDPWPATAWFAAYVVYGVALGLFLGLPVMRPGACGPHFPLVLAVTQSVTGLGLNYISGSYFGGTGVTMGLLIIVAAELPYILRPRTVWLWIGVQTIISTVMFIPAAGGFGLLTLLSFGVAMGGFQIFAVTSSMLLRREQASREQLAAANLELHATRALVAENSRNAERLRISRDLHDTLGHHLTALSLQLDVASRLTEGKAADHVRQAHAITRLLLADVRDVVGTLRETGRMDVAQAIRTFTVEQTGIAVHLNLPPSLVIDDPPRADALVRCVQEVITNAAKHSYARNLWIALEVKPDGVTIDAYDDGRGATSIDLGHGLTGMRERFEQNAGHVEFQWGPGSGFHVRGFLPLPALV
jgi:signal transduction histidine kinase